MLLLDGEVHHVPVSTFVRNDAHVRDVRHLRKTVVRADVDDKIGPHVFDSWDYVRLANDGSFQHNPELPVKAHDLRSTAQLVDCQSCRVRRVALLHVFSKDVVVGVSCCSRGHSYIIPNIYYIVNDRRYC